MNIILEVEGRDTEVTGFPSQCPWCKKMIALQYDVAGRTYLPYPDATYSSLDLVFRCTNIQCERLFIAHYQTYIVDSEANETIFHLDSLLPIKPECVDFDPTIKHLSSRFVHIFHEAEKAEAYSLKNVAGPGYRKAFEILIKDFLISLKPSDEAAIINEKKLAKLISERIDHVLLKESAARAAWLGNDEVHYARVWEDKDITDLKALIDIAVNFIAYELKAKAYIESMPSTTVVS